MKFEVKQAKRELIWVKLALMSPSGGGKTYSSLRLATGMLEELRKLKLEQNGKILFGNTEQKRGYYYANEFKYDIVDIQAPHNPEKYVEFIQWAVDEKYPILILDSSSHEWEGRGGCLELNQLAGGTYQSWGKVTPRHDKFIFEIADSPIHVLATMRGKDQYEMEKDSTSGKLNVKKMGVGAQQRSGFEYEFTATFNIDQKSNLADVQKDNTHLFEGESILLSEKHGERLIQWANSGEGYTMPVRAENVENIAALKEKVIEICTKLKGSKNPELMKVLKSFEPSGNPNKMKDVEEVKKLFTELQTLKVPEEKPTTESTEEN